MSWPRSWCAGVMVFLTIVLVFVMLIAFTFFCYVKAGIFDPTFVQDALDQAGDSGGTVSQQLVPSSTNKTKFKYAAYLMTAITIVLLLVVFAIRQSIVNAVHIISQAAKALSKNFGLVFYPLVTVSALFALMVYFVFVGAAMMSAGDKVSVDNLASDIAANVQAIQEKYPNYANVVNVTTAERQTLSVIEPLTATRYLFAYHFFGLLWTAQVIQGIGMMTIAGVIAKYVADAPRRAAAGCTHNCSAATISTVVSPTLWPASAARRLPRMAPPRRRGAAAAAAAPWCASLCAVP